MLQGGKEKRTKKGAGMRGIEVMKEKERAQVTWNSKLIDKAGIQISSSKNLPVLGFDIFPVFLEFTFMSTSNIRRRRGEKENERRKGKERNKGVREWEEENKVKEKSKY
jgi:hypothetical protein